MTQFFPLELLYRGTQLLLDGLLVDWQYKKEEQAAYGFFVHDNGLIKAGLSWPMSEEAAVKACGCQKTAKQSSGGCVHLAALAIETKEQLDQLVPPLKHADAHAKASDYLKHWLSMQSYDPFPNMARHRVVYLLDKKHDENAADEALEQAVHETFVLSLHKAYLTQQNQYQKKAILPLTTDLSNNNKLPKFISLTDQHIIAQIQALLELEPDRAVETNTLVLASSAANHPPATTTKIENLLASLASSGRLFWKSCYRQELKLMESSLLTEKLHKSHNPGGMRLSHSYYLQPADSQIIKIKTLVNQPLENFLQSLRQQDFKCTACLKLDSQQVFLEWAKKSIDIDTAEIQLLSDGQRVTLQELIDVLQNKQASGKLLTRAEQQQLMDTVVSFMRQVDALPGIQSLYQQPITQNFATNPRVLEGNLAQWLVLIRGLQLSGWKIEIANSFRMQQKTVESWYSQVTPVENKNQQHTTGSSSHDWFDLEVGIQIDGRKINLIPYIVELLNRNQFSETDQQQKILLTLKDGSKVAVSSQRINNIINHLLDLHRKDAITQKQQLRLPVKQAHRLLELEKHTDKIDWQNNNWLKNKAQSLINSQGVLKVDVPENLKTRLRSYQKQGLNWLQFLARENLSGILADDMGLGKTVQTLAHLQSEKNNGYMTGPSLIVAPTSLLGNWLSEAARFTPDLRAVYWAGNKRNIYQQQLKSTDLIITSYGLLLRDAQLFRQLKIYLLVLDEAQAIKNAKSKIARVAFSMQAQLKLCLTGTPLENHLGELWSLFHFLMPELLADEAGFKRLFQIPIEKQNNRQRQIILSQRIAPFILRRTKEKVAADLPKKIIINEFLELRELQAEKYESIRLSTLEEVQKAVSQKNSNQLLISNALLRLRQICCHPHLVRKIFRRKEDKDLITRQIDDYLTTCLTTRLTAGLTSLTAEPQQQELFKNTQADNDSRIKTTKNKNLLNHLIHDSAKLNWLNTKLPKMIENDRSILIFSSFTSMLEIIALLLKQLSISYLLLTGKTTHRDKIIDQFQSGHASVFLISLKAGGAGLNLTRADTVIHFDPWWNPAAENQASDRAHRIGQDKPVFVYKLIAKGTVEEKISKMQQQKSRLADKIYQQAEAGVAFEKIDWEFLLAPINQESVKPSQE